MLAWKIVVPAKASVLYIYIDYKYTNLFARTLRMRLFLQLAKLTWNKKKAKKKKKQI